jgi:hypothetical protein
MILATFVRDMLVRNASMAFCCRSHQHMFSKLGQINHMQFQGNKIEELTLQPTAELKLVGNRLSRLAQHSFG